MKIVRVPFAVSLALLAAAPAAAAVAPPPPPKPPAGDGADFVRNEWRGQAIGLCVGALREPEGITPDELDTMCGCAVDRFMTGRPTGALPPLASEVIWTRVRGPLLGCASGQRPAVAATLARRLAELPAAYVPAPDSKPSGPSGPTPAEAPKPPRASLSSWFEGLSLPSWLSSSGLPVWAWGVLGLLAFLLLRGLFRRDDRRDLVGPPRAMRLGQSPTPQSPRRADPPQRP